MSRLHLTIGKKIGLGFTAMLVLAAVLMGASKFALTVSDDRYTSLIENESAIVIHTNSAKIALLEARRNEKELFYADDQTMAADSKAAIGRLTGALDTIKGVTARVDDPKLAEDAAKLQELAAKYQKQFDTLLATPIGQERMVAAIGLRKAAKGVETLLNEFLQAVTARIAAETGKTRDETGAIARMVLILGLLLMAGGCALAFLITRAITRPLNLMQQVIAEVESSGDLSRRVQIASDDEVGHAARSFNQLMATLQAAFGQILGSVSEVSDSARALSASSGQAAASSSQQSEAAAAMAATVEQVTVSINQVSDNALEALALCRKSGDLSNQGGAIIHSASTEMMKIADIVRQTSTTIEDLGQKSNEINSVVKVIKDIANQTNLLALNAAIEAARAGEQGRGFAVVADEVRKLAERTAGSTEEINAMIATMQNSAQTAVSSMATAVTQVDSGVGLAQQAGDAVNQIKDSADQVITVVTSISSALTEQRTASNDIASHVEKVAQMSEQNSTAAGETAGAARNLEQLAGSMRTAAGKFKI